MNRNLVDSGIDWIGKIPQNWKVKRISSEFKIRNEKVNDKNYLPLSVTKLSEGVVAQLNNVAKSDAHEDRKLVLKGDFVINSRSDRKMSCGVSKYDGSVSLINIVLQPVGEILSDYSHYLFKNYGFSEEFYRWGHGIVADLWTTNSFDLKRICIPVPPKKEQEKIIKKICKKIFSIDKLIGNQEKEIHTLIMYKNALITKLVTKGFHMNDELIESNSPFLGLIPKNWQTSKAKFFFTDVFKGAGITKDKVFTDGDIQCIRYGEIYSKYDISFINTFSKTKEKEIDQKIYLKKGDLLFSGTGELIEEIGKNIVYLGDEKCLCGGDIIIVRHKQNCEYLNYLMNSTACQMQKSLGKSKLKVVHISADDIKNITIVIPPLYEQAEIVEYLNRKLIYINKIVEFKHKKIKLLQDYKKSLIYEFVTGKKEAN